MASFGVTWSVSTSAVSRAIRTWVAATAEWIRPASVGSGAPGVTQAEQIMAKHPAVQQCAVVGKKDLEAGEIPVAFVVLKQGAVATAEELLEYCSQNVSAYKKVRQIFFKPQLPVSGAGKILKTELRKELA